MRSDWQKVIVAVGETKRQTHAARLRTIIISCAIGAYGMRPGLDRSRSWLCGSAAKRMSRRRQQLSKDKEIGMFSAKNFGGRFSRPPFSLCLADSYFFFFADFFAAFFLVAMFSILPFDCSIDFATIFCCNC